MLDGSDLVLSKDGGGAITAGGYTIDSCLLKCGASPIVTMRGGGDKKGGKSTSRFEDLAVPAGLLYMQESVEKRFDNKDNMEVVSDSLYKELIDLAGTDQKERKPKKEKKQNKRSTRRANGKSSGKGTRRKK